MAPADSERLECKSGRGERSLLAIGAKSLARIQVAPQDLELCHLGSLSFSASRGFSSRLARSFRASRRRRRRRTQRGAVWASQTWRRWLAARRLRASVSPAASGASCTPLAGARDARFAPDLRDANLAGKSVKLCSCSVCLLRCLRARARECLLGWRATSSLGANKCPLVVALLRPTNRAAGHTPRRRD